MAPAGPARAVVVKLVLDPCPFVGIITDVNNKHKQNRFGSRGEI